MKCVTRVWDNAPEVASIAGRMRHGAGPHSVSGQHGSSRGVRTQQRLRHVVADLRARRIANKFPDGATTDSSEMRPKDRAVSFRYKCARPPRRVQLASLAVDHLLSAHLQLRSSQLWEITTPTNWPEARAESGENHSCASVRRLSCCRRGAATPAPADASCPISFASKPRSPSRALRPSRPRHSPEDRQKQSDSQSDRLDEMRTASGVRRSAEESRAPGFGAGSNIRGGGT